MTPPRRPLGNDKIANEMARDAIRKLHNAERATRLAESACQLALENLEFAKTVEADIRAKANCRIAYAETFKAKSA